MKSYVDLHRQFSADIETELETSLSRLGPSSHSVRHAVAKLLRHQKMEYPLSVLPLMVHGVETGACSPAIPLSAVHALWWASACYVDDLADARDAHAAADLSSHEGLLAAVVTGHILPFKALDSQRIPDQVRPALASEILNCGIVAAEGQLSDMRADVNAATRDSVVAVYRGKSGAPFGMITAMAATLAGTPDERVALWREFGYVFGILWQIFNDQEDITSGRNEDLQNGTVTYLLACALDDASPANRGCLEDLHAAAQSSDASRAELLGLLRDPSVLARYEKDTNEFRDEAHRLLTELGGDETYMPIMRHLVQQASGVLL
ncbi:polyprenyl synthetase family protein [Streptomyces avermitilis]|uniref:polyprenyl synthetase family protein n=1 Tax=Streptomyces avermitilis TaxID=33903 RepID=UPI0033F41138